MKTHYSPKKRGLTFENKNINADYQTVKSEYKDFFDLPDNSEYYY